MPCSYLILCMVCRCKLENREEAGGLISIMKSILSNYIGASSKGSLQLQVRNAVVYEHNGLHSVVNETMGCCAQDQNVSKRDILFELNGLLRNIGQQVVW